MTRPDATPLPVLVPPSVDRAYAVSGSSVSHDAVRRHAHACDAAIRALRGASLTERRRPIAGVRVALEANADVQPEVERVGRSSRRIECGRPHAREEPAARLGV